VKNRDFVFSCLVGRSEIKIDYVKRFLQRSTMVAMLPFKIHMSSLMANGTCWEVIKMKGSILMMLSLYFVKMSIP
jgi:hypothetical protein